MNIHPREDWQNSSQPIKGPAPKGQVKTWIVHYPGSSTTFQPMTDDQMIAWLRSTQDYYVSQRGYSLGYGWAVSQSGSIWEIRGDDFNNAANAGKKVSGNANDWTQSITIVAGGQNPASPAAVAAINELIASKGGRSIQVHQDVDWTSCAGTGITPQVRNGTIGYNSTPPPVEPPVPPPVEGVETLPMIAYYIVSGDSPWSVAEMVYGSGSQHTKLDASKFNSYSTPGNPVWCDTPDVGGTRTAVQNGEGPAAIIRRLVGSDAYPTSAQFETFYNWNGGWEQYFHPGDIVNMPS